MIINKQLKHFDTSTLLIIFLTLLLFIFAWFTTGYSHSLMLEAGVLLVSLKLIMMSYNLSKLNRQILTELNEIKNHCAQK